MDQQTKPKHKVTLRRVRLNSGGYDKHGTYWGTGKALYWYAFHDHLSNLEHSDHIRADNRAEARRLIRDKFASREMNFYN